MRDGLSAWVAGVLAEAVRPPKKLNVAEWAAERRIVSAESGSPHPGRWRHEHTPHLLEVMEELSPDSDATDIWVQKSAQSGFSESAINLCGHTIDVNPRPIIYVLPSIDEAQKFSGIKLQGTIDETPELAAKVRGDTVKGAPGSTITRKKFRGGYIVIANAHSSSALQMLSAAILICDEVSEYPEDAGGRGDPVRQAVRRTTAYERQRPKRYFLSVPGIKGHCRIEAGMRGSDQRRYYMPCPECGWFQPLRRTRLRWQSDTAPHRPYFECAAHGCVIEERHLERMANDRGGRLWLKCYVDEADPDGNPAPPEAVAPEDFDRWRARPSGGRDPGFYFWQGQSLLASWESIVKSLLDANTPQARRVHTQQVEGEPYEEKGEAPDAEKLLLARERRPLGVVPPGFPVLTGAVDVQGDRLEWAVYAWGPGMRSALVDYGQCMGTTDGQQVWAELDGVIGRDWRVAGDGGRKLRPDLWCLDAGYRSPRVYQFCRLRGGILGRVVPVMGAETDSRLAAVAPLVSKPRPVQYEWDGKPVEGGVERYDLGTWPLKQLLHEGLRLALRGPDDSGVWQPGTIRFAEGCDLEFFEQITAESLVTQTDRLGRSRRSWHKRRPRNEQTDLWVYCRAGAELLELAGLSDEEWRQIGAARGEAQGELFGPAAEIRQEGRGNAPARPQPEPERRQAPADNWLGDVGDRWL